MIHPIDYVYSMVRQGKTNEVIDLLREFLDDLDERKTPDHAIVYRFSSMFLISVMGQLHHLKLGQDLQDDPTLSVWAALGFFGILRESIPGNCAE